MNAKTTRFLGQTAAFALGIGCALSATAGTPGFSAQTAFAAGNAPYAVAVGDLNGDGKPDVVTTNDPDGTVSVFMNTTNAGDSVPSFAPQAAFQVGAFPESVIIADVNGDGLPDIVTSNTSDNTITVLLNTTLNGATTPTFAAPQVIAAGAYPESVIALDVNGDGKPDLAVADYSDSTITVLINATVTGSTTVDFSNQQVFPVNVGPFQLAAADINGDGLPDIVAADYGSGSISVLLNTTANGASTPSFAAPQYFGVGGMGDSIALVAADLNRDGLPDVAVVDTAAGQATVLVNTTVAGSSTVSFDAPQAFAIGTYGQGITVADVDLDGTPDLVVTNYMDSTISVLHNTTVPGSATMSFDAQLTFATDLNPVGVAAADLNSDGKLDIVTANNSGNTMSVLLNTTP